MEAVCEEKKVVSAYILKPGIGFIAGSLYLGEAYLGNGLQVYALDGDRVDELAEMEDTNAVELVEDGAPCYLLEDKAEEIPHSAEDDLPENNEPAKQEAILLRGAVCKKGHLSGVHIDTVRAAMERHPGAILIAWGADGMARRAIQRPGRGWDHQPLAVTVRVVEEL